VSNARQHIEDYAMIGDLQTAALVGRDGSIDWLCLPHFDSGACFAALLHDESAGSWRLAPAGGGDRTEPERPSRRYLEDSLVLETTWRTEQGTVRVVDLMPPRGQAADIVRIAEGIEGRVTMESAMRLRFDYGSFRPWVRADGHDALAVAGPDSAWFHADVDVEADEDRLLARFALGAGDRVGFVLTHQASHLGRPDPVDPDRALARTKEFWREWIDRCQYDGRWAPAVRRALVTLKALTFAPTGGVLAAATTSLPEEIGGVRNWDYRFCWLRDATHTLQALLGTGYVEEATAWREWLVRAVAGDPAELQLMYGVDGRRRLPEMTLPWLDGFAGSQPVRIGNAAAEQLQLDVWGEVLDGLHLARQSGIEVSGPAWDIQRALLDWLEGNWQQPDHGLWEMRGGRRDFVHSKAMAWAGVDRAVRAVEAYPLDGPVDRWRELRERIHREVCERGYDAERGTFTQFYGSTGVDAALLLLPQAGFLPWSDPRVRGTVAAIERELSVDGLTRRYNPDADAGTDGLPGGEGVFVACSFWLADALAATGRAPEAEKLFARLLDLRNDVGLLSEEYDVASGHHLGNTPQAYSMVGLVNTARALEGRV